MADAFALTDVLISPEARAALTWEDFREGVEVSWVYRTDDPDGISAAFLRYAPGAGVPMHYHPGYEHILVLEGSQSDANGLYRAGSVAINPAGTQHAVHSEEGCIVLAIWEKPVRFV